MKRRALMFCGALAVLSGGLFCVWLGRGREIRVSVCDIIKEVPNRPENPTEAMRTQSSRWNGKTVCISASGYDIDSRPVPILICLRSGHESAGDCIHLSGNIKPLEGGVSPGTLVKLHGLLTARIADATVAGQVQMYYNLSVSAIEISSANSVQ